MRHISTEAQKCGFRHGVDDAIRLRRLARDRRHENRRSGAPRLHQRHSLLDEHCRARNVHIERCVPLLARCLQIPAPEDRVGADREIHPAEFFDGGSKKRVEICIRRHVGAHEAPGIAHVG